MSPERLKGEKHDYSSDIWSVGMIIMKILKGFTFKDNLKVGFWKMIKITTDQKLIDDSIFELKVSKDLSNFLYSWFEKIFF